MILSTALIFSFLILTITAAPSTHEPLNNHKRFRPLPKIYSDARARSASSSFLHLDNPPTAPLTRIAIRNERNQHLHPYMLFQQHLNRAHRRRSVMAGVAPPSQDELAGLMQKRWISLTGGKEGELKLRKRQRGGKALGSSPGGGAGGANALIGKPGEQVPQNGASWSLIASDEKVDGANSFALANAEGFPKVALDAATQGTVSKAITPTAAQTIGEDIEANDVGYFTTVQIGTPPKDYKLLLDSGSSDMWMPSENCATCGATHTTLGTTSSSTFKALTQTFAITFGTGQVSGTLAQDDVTIAGLKLPQHTFGVTTIESADFGAAGVPFDGLMGLAKSQLSTQKTPTPIESMATFGGVDSSKFTGTLTEFANVSPQGFWEGAMSDVQVNGKSLNLAGRTAILDTTAIHAAIPGSATDGQGGFAVPCTNTAVISLAFNGTSFTINPSDLAFVPVNTNDLAGLCISGIASGQIGGPNEWLVGDVFLKNVYFATDVAANKMGLAPALNAVPAPAMTTEINSLAPETLARIFELATEVDKHSVGFLRATSLVCQAWRYESQAQLWRNIHISNGMELEFSFGSCRILDSPALGRFATVKATFSMTRELPLRNATKVITRIVKSLHGLRELSFVGVTDLPASLFLIENLIGT
ncbi:hypothetical protein RQP46_010365 [Phenoliferia psychrophenolica]